MIINKQGAKIEEITRPCDGQFTNGLDEQCLDELEELVRINELIDKAYQLSIGYTSMAIERPLFYQNKESDDYHLMELFNVLKKLEIDINNSYTVVTTMNLEDWVSYGSNFYDEHTRRVINTCKAMSAFQAIDRRDRVTLVKYSGIEVLILRSVLRYDTMEEAWKYPSVGRHPRT